MLDLLRSSSQPLSSLPVAAYGIVGPYPSFSLLVQIDAVPGFRKRQGGRASQVRMGNARTCRHRRRHDAAAPQRHLRRQGLHRLPVPAHVQQPMPQRRRGAHQYAGRIRCSPDAGQRRPPAHCVILPWPGTEISTRRIGSLFPLPHQSNPAIRMAFQQRRGPAAKRACAVRGQAARHAGCARDASPAWRYAARREWQVRQARVFCAVGPAIYCKCGIQAPMGTIPGACELGGAPARIIAGRGGNGHGRSGNTHKRGALPPCIHPSSGAAAPQQRLGADCPQLGRHSQKVRRPVPQPDCRQKLPPADACGKGRLSAHDSQPAAESPDCGAFTARVLSPIFERNKTTERTRPPWKGPARSSATESLRRRVCRARDWPDARPYAPQGMHVPQAPELPFRARCLPATIPEPGRSGDVNCHLDCKTSDKAGGDQNQR